MTASGAEEAVSKAEGLTIAMDTAEKLQGAQLDAEIAGLRQVIVRQWHSSLQLTCQSQLRPFHTSRMQQRSAPASRPKCTGCSSGAASEICIRSLETSKA